MSETSPGCAHVFECFASISFRPLKSCEEWSVQTRPEWSLMREIMLTNLVARPDRSLQDVHLRFLKLISFSFLFYPMLVFWGLYLRLSFRLMRRPSSACVCSPVAEEPCFKHHTLQMVEFEDVLWAGNLPTYCKARLKFWPRFECWCRSSTKFLTWRPPSHTFRFSNLSLRADVWSHDYKNGTTAQEIWGLRWTELFCFLLLPLVNSLSHRTWAQELNFFNVTTSDDPVLPDCGTLTLFATFFLKQTARVGLQGDRVAVCCRATGLCPDQSHEYMVKMGSVVRFQSFWPLFFAWSVTLHDSWPDF